MCLSVFQWVFGAPFKPEYYDRYSDDERKFSREIMEMWSNFARAGYALFQTEFSTYLRSELYSSTTQQPLTTYLNRLFWLKVIISTYYGVH